MFTRDQTIIQTVVYATEAQNRWIFIRTGREKNKKHESTVCVGCRYLWNWSKVIWLPFPYVSVLAKQNKTTLPLTGTKQATN